MSSIMEDAATAAAEAVAQAVLDAIWDATRPLPLSPPEHLNLPLLNKTGSSMLSRLMPSTL